MTDRVLVEMTIATPAATLWDAIRHPASIHNWFGWDAPGLKDEIDFIFVDHVLPDEDARILRFQGVPDRFEVIDRGATSILRIVRALPGDEDPEPVYDDMIEGWISFAQQLRLAIEQHGLGARRTIYLEGAAREGGGAASETLGLSAARDLPAGAPVSVALATGDRIEGVAWHRTPCQLGLTVPDWGDGLLIVTDKPPTDAAPHGRGMVVLTTYGLADDAFAAIEARWQAWWATHYEVPPDPAA